MDKNPAFLFYHFDWLRDTSVRMLTDAERGIYVDILCHSYQRGGKLWLRTGEGTPTLDDLCRLLGLEQTKCAKVLANLVRLGCLELDENGVYFNKRMFTDVQRLEKKRAAGKVGGMKSKPSETSIANLRNSESILESKTEAPSKANSKAENQFSRNISYSSSVSINNNSLSRAEAKMPTSESEAVEMCAGIGVPDDFILTKAYPRAVAVGFVDRGSRIVNWAQWVKNYWCASDNSRRKQEQQKESKPRGRLYDDTPVRELKL